MFVIVSLAFLGVAVAGWSCSNFLADTRRLYTEVRMSSYSFVIYDPCLLELPEVLTVAHEASGFKTQSKSRNVATWKEDGFLLCSPPF